MKKEITINGKIFSLADLKARPSTFNLIAPDGTEVSLTLRPINLQDEAYIQREIGEDKFQKALENVEIPILCKFVFAQLDLASKTLLKNIKLIDMDEEGNEFEMAPGPLSEKLKYLIAGYENAYAMYTALLEARGLSMPMVDAIMEEELKKKEEQTDPAA